MILMVLKTGHMYRLDDTLTLTNVNDALAANTGKFFQVPLHPEQPLMAGQPVIGTLQGLFITPDSVSHFQAVT